MSVVLRKARVEDKARVLQVEAKSTPNLRYLGAVFEHWVHDQVGELLVAELDGEMVGVGKLTQVPDDSAWLEALRVIPEAQGRGIGKRFYERFFEIAHAQQIPAMRMYTGVRNTVSKGLAERFGFHLAATYRGVWRAVDAVGKDRPVNGFIQVTDPVRATELLMLFEEQWTGFLVMNRTFYALSPALCTAWASEGKVYYDANSDSVIVLGARFQADLALNIACLGGDVEKCLAFAEQQARELAVPRVQCMFPPTAAVIEQAMLSHGYQVELSDCIVMEVRGGKQ